MKKIGIVGGTGYTGVELLRLLVRHPEIEMTQVTSRAQAGQKVADLFPNLRGHLDLNFVAPDADNLADCDLLFYATPNGTAMQQVPALLDAGVKVIDLAADFRLKDAAVWQKWYGMAHICPDLLAEAVYGLPEINRAMIKDARLVANPGCYPTAVQLGFLPLLKAGVIHTQDLIADTKSGVSGAGRQAAIGTLLGEAGENFKAYKADGHRHWPEILQGLGNMAGNPVDLCFVPHLVPMIRGIHATLYAKLSDKSVDLQALFEQAYTDEQFVDVLPAGSHPETRSVRGTNTCRIAIHRAPDSDRVIILSVIDNLVKGAAGQAIQNMNLMFGWREDLGLESPALLP